MATNYKDTTNLPQTEFPMRGNLAQNEPKRLAAWEQANLYELARSTRENAKPFILHDGPPYANGPIHLGHALNKISKDFINRLAIMQGRRITFIPGWDCHGQPIEHKVEEQLGTAKFRSMPIPKIRELCEMCATENIDLQKAGFRRLGVLADWDHAYLTLSHTHDACDIEIFKHIWESGAIYRGKKPVHWCTHCQTALAEAEIEYAEVEGPSIFVAFALDETPEQLSALKKPVSLAVWTTTPWTLPANAGVTIKPDGVYVLLETKDAYYVVLQELAENLAQVANTDYKLAKDASGSPIQLEASALVGLHYTHPIFSSVHPPIISADFVTTDSGTGLVHTAPGHGADDYYAGAEYGLEVVMPVNDAGEFYSGTDYGTGGPFSGENVWDANERIISYLAEAGTLIAKQTISHSYPHCWRCKNPVIFRATNQWFVSMDKTGLRDETLDFVRNHIAWYPKNSIKRIESMLENRPDWCISRQRVWGVPIPAFVCKDCGEVLITSETLEKTIALFEERGSDAWFELEPASYLGSAAKCAHCGSTNIEPGRDILDVWWDSGVSHTAVLMKRPDLDFPADLYLEGSDQHRGWFQSSLLTSVGAWNKPPFKECVTLGFTLDGEGRKMSKSLGNVIDPNKIADTMGADVIRLWVASVDAMQDMPCNMEILQRVSEAYRRFRNTYRFLLGGLEEGFDVATSGVTLENMKAYDKCVLARACEVHQLVCKAYEEYRFNQVYRLLYDFVVSDLSNGYLNATKDRMYCDARAWKSRKSAQVVYFHILAMLISDLQPILAYTADEALQYAPHALKQGVEFAALLPWWQAPMAGEELDTYAQMYDALYEVKNAFTKAYEQALTTQQLPDKTTTATQAQITLPKELYQTLHPMLDELAETLVCARVHVEEGSELTVDVEPAAGEKCPRCWNWRHLEPSGLCKRCDEALHTS